tara:strand:+ start:153 stop:371 length:219 start_codon:yes stop_codon:yes gene_type:complete
MQTIELTREETRNLIDALLEWERIVEPKELEPDEVGLNDERYILLMQKLIDGLKNTSPVPYPEFDYNKKSED